MAFPLRIGSDGAVLGVDGGFMWVDAERQRSGVGGALHHLFVTLAAKQQPAERPADGGSSLGRWLGFDAGDKDNDLSTGTEGYTNIDRLESITLLCAVQHWSLSSLTKGSEIRVSPTAIAAARVPQRPRFNFV